MKPSSDYMDWMMAPEQKDFRRRLNEQKEKLGWRLRDVFKLPYAANQYVVTAEGMGRTGVWAVCLGDIRGRADFFTRSQLRQSCEWLPDLGQLVRLIHQETGLLPTGMDLTWHGSLKPEIAAASLLEELWGLT